MGSEEQEAPSALASGASTLRHCLLCGLCPGPSTFLLSFSSLSPWADPQGGRVPSGPRDSLSVSGPGPWHPHTGEFPSPERQARPLTFFHCLTPEGTAKQHRNQGSLCNRCLWEPQGLLKESLAQLGASGPLLHGTSSGLPGQGPPPLAQGSPCLCDCVCGGGV